tara:strand:+ start:640 stop:825 length:186 start_codon:yes stop_codon:yes gene_type:complete
MLVNLSKRNIELFQDLIRMEIYNCNQDKLPFKKEYKKYLRNVLTNLKKYDIPKDRNARKDI